ncbi:MAG TPA: threonine/serine dehydratase [Candidatus Eisenbacteria bacterium]|jgi:threonine dehydratase|nr:threonine/serine dehydratase [Candidatus Eisenbacteria bacterium]
MLIALEAIRDAATRTAPYLHRTPVLTSRTLGERAGVRLHLKCECFQKTGSFKPRGALNIVLSLSDERRARGLITVSAGNHAQAVAWAARVAQAPCTVVMPTDAPRSKMDATRSYGATIITHDDRATLFDRLHEEEKRTGATFVHPFDDPVGLAGAGTAGLEILEQVPEVECVVVPIGGGGLMAGVASAVKGAKPECRVVGVELLAGPGMQPALAAGKPVPVPRPQTVADGLTPPFVGARPLEIAREAVDEIVLVSESEILEAMRQLLVRAKLYVEGAGATATAALLAGKIRVPTGATVVTLVSGGNVDPERMLAAFSTEGER